MREKCGIIVARQGEFPGVKELDPFHNKPSYLAECILYDGHDEPHVIKTPEGKFFAWKDDPDCDCCDPIDPDRCYVFWEIKESEFLEYNNF